MAYGKIAKKPGHSQSPNSRLQHAHNTRMGQWHLAKGALDWAGRSLVLENWQQELSDSIRCRAVEANTRVAAALAELRLVMHDAHAEVRVRNNFKVDQNESK